MLPLFAVFQFQSTSVLTTKPKLCNTEPAELASPTSTQSLSSRACPRSPSSSVRHVSSSPNYEHSTTCERSVLSTLQAQTTLRPAAQLRRGARRSPARARRHVVTKRSGVEDARHRRDATRTLAARSRRQRQAEAGRGTVRRTAAQQEG